MSTLQMQGQEFKKKLILQEAASILAHKPYETVTMDEVAKALGCGKSTLYKYFTSKESLFAYVIYEQLDEFSQQLEKNCLKNPRTLDALIQCLELSYRFFRQNCQLFSSWLRYESNTEVSSELFDKIYQLMQDKQNHMVILFQRGITEGLVKDSFDALSLTRMVEKIFLSCVFSPLGETSEDDEKNLLLLKHILSNGILTPAALAQPRMMLEATNDRQGASNDECE